ncbi:MAG: EVE domain-containing protein [Verrucomicrobia bacterium]|nr:EVE domain-containing protein [Verrucomicrobiota bacterium]
MIKYWIGVVSRQHVLRGVKGGFAQVCHGKKAPLSRMKQGDILIYYSPKESMDGNEKCQKFTALGKVMSDKPYAFDMGGGFIPYRMDIDYLQCKEASILPLLEVLSFTQGTSNWGMKFRFGMFEISKADFDIIAEAMHF